jgi:hypothetical protein
MTPLCVHFLVSELGPNNALQRPGVALTISRHLDLQ